jgi:hypothetical protein
MSDYNQKLESVKQDNWKANAAQQATLTQQSDAARIKAENAAQLSTSEELENRKRTANAAYWNSISGMDPLERAALTAANSTPENYYANIAGKLRFDPKANAYITEGQAIYNDKVTQWEVSARLRGLTPQDPAYQMVVSGLRNKTETEIFHDFEIDPLNPKALRAVPNRTENLTPLKPPKMTGVDMRYMNDATSSIISSGLDKITGLQRVSQTLYNPDGSSSEVASFRGNNSTPLGQAQNTWIGEFESRANQIYLNNRDEGMSFTAAAQKAWEETTRLQGPLAKPHAFAAAAPPPPPPGTVVGKIGVYTPQDIARLQTGLNEYLSDPPDKFKTRWSNDIPAARALVAKLYDAGLATQADKFMEILTPLLSTEEQLMQKVNQGGSNLAAQVGRHVGSAVDYAAGGVNAAGRDSVRAGQDLMDTIKNLLGGK